MKALPDLDRLRVGEKDDLIRALFAQAKVLLPVDVVTARVTEPGGRLALNSRNSGKPPSPDDSGRSKSRRRKGLNSTGGRKGHRGYTLKKVAQPDCPSSRTCRRAGAMPAIGHGPIAGQWSRRARCSNFRPCVRACLRSR